MDTAQTIEKIQEINDLANKILEINCQLIHKNSKTIIELNKIKNEVNEAATSKNLRGKPDKTEVIASFTKEANIEDCI